MLYVYVQVQKMTFRNTSMNIQHYHTPHSNTINQSTLFKYGRWLSKLVFRHAVYQLQIIKNKTSD